MILLTSQNFNPHSNTYRSKNRMIGHSKVQSTKNATVDQIYFKGRFHFNDVVKLINNDDNLKLKKIKNLFLVNSNLRTLLHESCIKEKVEASNILAKRGLNINQKDIKGKTPFAITCATKNIELFDKMAIHNPDINTQDISGNTPLHKSIPSIAILDRLLDMGANPYLKNKLGMPVLHSAVGHDEALHFLLKKGVNPDSINDAQESLLHVASKESNIDLAKTMLDYKAEVNFKNLNNETPLFFSKNIDMTKLYLENGAKIDVRDNKLKQTALHRFVQNNDYGSVKEMFKYKANPNIADINGATPLLHAKNNKMRRILLENGANPDIKFPDKESLLYKSIIENKDELSRERKANLNELSCLLLKHKANPNEYPYMHIALDVENDFLIDALLKAKVNLKKEYDDILSPIFFCKNDRHLSKLIESGIDKTAIDNDGNTFLHHCYAKGYDKMAKVLEDNYELKYNIKNKQDLSAAQVQSRAQKYSSWFINKGYKK